MSKFAEMFLTRYNLPPLGLTPLASPQLGFPPRRLPRLGVSAAGLSALACSLLITGSVLSPAWAQSVLSPTSAATGGNTPGGRHGGPAPEPEKPAIPPPDAIPGAKAREPAAPATRAVTDMAPNEALFDAINRGDIAAARDSLNRGADLDAVNILGMTPMEVSVDLGRNDISFLLLSMRGEDSGRGGRLADHQVPLPQSDHQLPSVKVATVKKAAARVTRATAVKPVAVAPKPVATPKLFANDGGTPLPKAGFLGFDTRSATN